MDYGSYAWGHLSEFVSAIGVSLSTECILSVFLSECLSAIGVSVSTVVGLSVFCLCFYLSVCLL